MKKTVILSALMLLSMFISLSAQDRKFIYAQFAISYSWTNNGVILIADMGTPQEKMQTFDHNYIKDTDGKYKIFNTPMGAVNWLARDGWELGENCTGIDTTTFIMKKDVSGMSDDQINDFLSRYIIGSSTGKRYTPNKKKRFQMSTLEEYIENEIIPRYAAFDAAHREDHARSVISQCAELASHYDVNPELLYAAAAYHDLGLAEGRDLHHIASGRIIREDRRLREWFSEDEIETMAQAAEDHRASRKEPPRSIYGMILAEADRLIDPDTVIRRTVQFGFSHYPEMSRRQMWERTLTHLKEKYGDGGYLKLWIPESDNAGRLAELRRIIADEKELRRRFDEVYRDERFRPAVCERFVNDEKYRKGHVGIVAAKPGTVIMGLHTPEMKAFAKEDAARPEWREDLKFMASSAAISPLSHEERTIWGLTVDYVKCGISERLEYLDALIPYIDNWAICDTVCCNAKWADKASDRPAVWQYIMRKLKSRKEFTRRVGIVLMLGHFLDKDYFGRCLEALTSMNLVYGEPYYVRMGVAWLLATALAKFPDETREFVSSASLPEDIVSLYVRKARESFRTRHVPALK